MPIDNTMNNELGFRPGSGYIARWDEREPLDQTNLKNGLDSISRSVGGRFQKLSWIDDCSRPGGPIIRPGGLTGGTHVVCFVVKSSRVF